jgi:hypothetical protein
MKPSPCSRLFEAEAARDGRLTGVEREKFERHATGCVACARETAELAALAETLRRPNVTPRDEFHAQREKTRLLAAFDRRLLTPPKNPRLQRLWLWSAATLVLLVAGLGLRPLRSGGAPANVSTPPVAVRADSATVWSKRLEGTRELILLERGTLWIRVDHTQSERKVRVALPDGELEDIGTTFTVTAEEGHTSHITVQEGRVVLRLLNQSARTISAGEEWIPPQRTPAPAPASASSVSQPSPDSGGHSSSVRASDAAAAEFRRALAALNRGDNAQAAQEFAEFLQRHPHDGRGEDAAYLRIIARQRSGDRAGLETAAADFLRRYPSGFRRAEVERLLR